MVTIGFPDVGDDDDICRSDLRSSASCSYYRRSPFLFPLGFHAPVRSRPWTVTTTTANSLHESPSIYCLDVIRFGSGQVPGPRSERPQDKGAPGLATGAGQHPPIPASPPRLSLCCRHWPGKACRKTCWQLKPITAPRYSSIVNLRHIISTYLSKLLVDVACIIILE